MTTKRKPMPVSPIPAVVEVEDGVHFSLLKRFGSVSITPPPVKHKSSPKMVSPLAVFQGDGRYFKAQASSNRSYGGDDSTAGTFPGERIGIRRPKYGRDDDESSHEHGGTLGESSHRIGITRPDYNLHEVQGAPISPLNLFLEKKATSSTPNLVELDHSEDSSDPLVAWNHSRERSTSRDSADSYEHHVKDDDSIERIIHEATAEGHYLVGSTPLSTPKDDIKFSLTKRRGGLSKTLKRASERHVSRPPRPSVERSASTSDTLGAPDASFKIFLLLLNPKARIFELIQVIYSPSVATIGSILAKIPGNATEPALGSQSYIGLCRPKDGIEITDMTLMASGSHCKQSCARIILGEILVAIPTGFTGEKCAKLAVPILKNERIQTLLKRSDPLGIKRTHSSSSSSRGSRTGRRRRSRSNSHSSSRVETVNEEPGSPGSGENSPGSGENSPQIKQALQHAREAAAMANAGCPDTSATSHDERHLHRNQSIDSCIHQMEHWRSTTDFADTASLNDSIASSSAISTTSSHMSGLSNTMSFQSSSARRLPRMSRSAARRKHRREQRSYYTPRVVAVTLTAMVTRFMLDSAAPMNREDVNEILGWMGLIQFVLVFALLLKIQKFWQEGHNAAETKCPFVRVSMAAAESFQEKFNLQK